MEKTSRIDAFWLQTEEEKQTIWSTGNQAKRRQVYLQNANNIIMAKQSLAQSSRSEQASELITNEHVSYLMSNQF